MSDKDFLNEVLLKCREMEMLLLKGSKQEVLHNDDMTKLCQTYSTFRNEVNTLLIKVEKRENDE